MLVGQDKTLLGLFAIALALIVHSQRWKPAGYSAARHDGRNDRHLRLSGHAPEPPGGSRRGQFAGDCGAEPAEPADRTGCNRPGITGDFWASIGCLRQVTEMHRLDQRRSLAALADAPGGAGPILAQNPELSMLAGERPYVLDPFMFRVLSEQLRGYADPMLDRLDRREFRAVILRDIPGDPLYESNEYDFGRTFMEHLRRDYVLEVGTGGRIL